jgi:DNA repair exonuclease SbcCD nuclease subunit
MIKKIAHTADWHIRSGLSRQDEYKEVFENFITDLKITKPDRIVIVGDIFHNYIEPSNEGLLLAGDILNRLSEIAKVIITRGNHDIQKKNLKRVDSIQTVVDLIKNPNIHYLNRTDFFEDENVVWVVWHHGDKTNPWKELQHVKDETKTYIDLYHNPIRGCKTQSNLVMNSTNYRSITDFKNTDIIMAGDLHEFQYLTK